AIPCSEAARPKGAGVDLRLIYPDPQTDPALIRAKLILARLFRGDRASAAEELKAFRAAHPQSAGLLAGGKGRYADILKEIIDKATPAVVESHAWPTFAGDGARNGAVARLPKIKWLEQSWRASLDPGWEKGKVFPPGEVRNASQLAQTLAFFPVIAGDRVLVADSGHVMLFNLLSGQRLARVDLLAHLRALPAPVPF